jgi:hypothetical protein
MSAIRNNPNELLRHQREVTRSVLLRRERIRQLIQDGEPPNSVRLQVLRRAVDLDTVTILLSHRELRLT